MQTRWLFFSVCIIVGWLIWIEAREQKHKIIYVDREQCSSYEQDSIKEQTVTSMVKFLVTTNNAVLRYQDKLYTVTVKEKE